MIVRIKNGDEIGRLQHLHFGGNRQHVRHRARPAGLFGFGRGKPRGLHVAMLFDNGRRPWLQHRVLVIADDDVGARRQILHRAHAPQSPLPDSGEIRNRGGMRAFLACAGHWRTQRQRNGENRTREFSGHHRRLRQLSISLTLRSVTRKGEYAPRPTQSSPARPRVRLMRERFAFASSRRSTAARGGRVARRGFGTSAARRISAISRARASSRLRS